MLRSCSASCYVRNSHDKNLFERTLSTIQSPTLRTVPVHVTNYIVMGRDKTVTLPKSDWRGVDSLLCDLLTRERTQNPL